MGSSPTPGTILVGLRVGNLDLKWIIRSCLNENENPEWLSENGKEWERHREGLSPSPWHHRFRLGLRRGLDRRTAGRWVNLPWKPRRWTGSFEGGAVGARPVGGRGDARSDRDELQAARVLSADVPLLAALEEGRKARSLTAGNLIAAAEAWATRSGTDFEVIDEKTAVEKFLRAKKAGGIDATASYNEN